jgi:hypothetical protein
VAHSLKHPDATLERAEARPTTSPSLPAPLVLPPKPRARQRQVESSDLFSAGRPAQVDAAAVRAKVTAPGGARIQRIAELDERAVRAAFVTALTRTT